MNRTLIACLFAATACVAHAASQPPAKAPPSGDTRKMSTVYVLAHAAAILDLCMASPDAASFPEAKSKEIQDLAARLGGIVRTIGTHYRDAELMGVYDATKAQLATDTKLRFHVKNNHQNCGERTLGDMRAYVGENEALIGNFLAGKKK
jgi:hypothetical protein